MRCLDAAAWHDAPDLVESLVAEIVAPYGVRAEVVYTRNVPPVDNEATSIEVLTAAVRATEGPDAVVGTEQSLGGEDFAWYLEASPGRWPGSASAGRRCRCTSGWTCTRAASTPTKGPSRSAPGCLWPQPTSPCSRSDNGLV